MNVLEEHHRKLERLYTAAPTNVYYRPTISIGAGIAEIQIDVRSDFFHTAAAVHGSVYFTLYFLRPVASGALAARGKVLISGGRQFVAEAQLFNNDSRLIAHGTGTYVRSKIALGPELSYA